MIFFKFETFCVKGGNSIYCQGVNLLPCPSCPPPPGHTAPFLIPAALRQKHWDDLRTGTKTTTSFKDRYASPSWLFLRQYNKEWQHQEAINNIQTKTTTVKGLWLTAHLARVCPAPNHTRPLSPAHCNQHLDYVTKESLSSTIVCIISLVIISNRSSGLQQVWAGQSHF